MAELRSRCWVAECPDTSGDPEPSRMWIKFTERETGQLDGKVATPFDVDCWTGDHEVHTARPCTEQAFDDA